MKHRLEYSFFYLFILIARFWGIKRVKHLAKFIAWLFYFIIPIRKKVVLKNLRLAFPEKSEDEIKKIAYSNYYNMALTFLEIPLIKYMNREQVLSLAEFENFDRVKNSFDEKKGILFLTAHFGNWELGAVLVGLYIQNQISVLAKNQKNKLVSNVMTEIREKFGNKEIYLGVSVRQLYKTLKEGGAIGVVADQRAPRDSIKVNFFNHKTPVFPGAASIALKLKSPIYFVLITRIEAGKFLITNEVIDYNNLPESDEDAVIEITQRYINLLEKNIRKYPDQWLWMHNIWKYL